MKELKERKINVLLCCVRVCCILIMCCFTIGMNAQVTIGSNKIPQGGSLLELKQYDPGADNATSDKGMLYPRVKLDENYKNELHPMYDVTSSDYITNKAALKKSHMGLVVFNITTSDSFTPGLYCWNGDSWRRLDDSPSIKPGIGSKQLLCSSAVLTPSTYAKDIPLKDYYLKVPYLGGTGGSYEGAAPVAGTNGLSIERIGGKLAYGSGEVVYRVTGTPENSSPATTLFPIDFLGESCYATVGSVSSVNLRNLEEDVRVTSLFHTNYNGELATELKFGDITIEEAGSYAFSLRLYGLVGHNTATRMPYYIYLQKNNKNNLVDAAEIDLVLVSTSDYTDYSYSITLGGIFDVGDKVIISMNRASNQASNWEGPVWRLKMGGNPTTPVRTSLIYWKL